MTDTKAENRKAWQQQWNSINYAIVTMNQTQWVFACEFKGKRFDANNKEGYLETSIGYGLTHPEIHDDLRKYIVRLAGTLDAEKK